jgi:hypothetical protein
MLGLTLMILVGTLWVTGRCCNLSCGISHRGDGKTQRQVGWSVVAGKFVQRGFVGFKPKTERTGLPVLENIEVLNFAIDVDGSRAVPNARNLPGVENLSASFISSEVGIWEQDHWIAEVPRWRGQTHPRFDWVWQYFDFRAMPKAMGWRRATIVEFESGSGKGTITEREHEIRDSGYIGAQLSPRGVATYFDRHSKDNRLPDESEQLESANTHSGYSQSDGPPIGIVFFLYALGFLGGFLMALAGVQQLYHERRAFGSALIVGGVCAAILGDCVLLGLFDSSLTWLAVYVWCAA